MPNPPEPRRRKRSARFVDIAAAAQVSVATVNRVLNERGSVAAETRARVVQAARQLAVPRALPDPRHGLTRWNVLIPRSATPFGRRLEQGFDRAVHWLDRRIVLQRQSLPDDEDALVALLLRTTPRRDGLIVATPDTPRLREALQQVVARGVPVVTLMSDIAEVPRLHYAGIDNLQAGRTAGHFLGRLAPGPGRVLVLSNALRFRAHADRTQGCCAVLRERFPALRVAPVIECFDDPDRNFLAVDAALRDNREGPLVGLYHSGAGAAGIAAALQRHAGRPRPVWVGHELSDEHRACLQSGTLDLVIDQDPDGQVFASLQHLLHACGFVDKAPPQGPNEFRLFCRENLPAQPYLAAVRNA